MIYEGALKAPIFLNFLHRLIREAARKLFVIVDNLPVHRAHRVTAWMQDNAAFSRRMTLPRNARSTPAPARSTAPPISILIAAVLQTARLAGTIGTKSGMATPNKIGHGNAGIGQRAGSQFPTPYIKLS